MTAVNKWNKKKYKVVNVTENNVTLERTDGSTFTIAKSEFNFTYITE